jgi:hypothetical protein
MMPDLLYIVVAGGSEVGRVETFVSSASEIFIWTSHSFRTRISRRYPEVEAENGNGIA